MIEALTKHKAQRLAVDGMNTYGPIPNFSKHRNEVRHNGRRHQTVNLVMKSFINQDCPIAFADDSFWNVRICFFSLFLEKGWLDKKEII